MVEIIIGAALWIFWLMAENEELNLLWIVILIFLEQGFGSILNSVHVKKVEFIIYESGIYGRAAKINPFTGFLSKSLAFDIPFKDISSMR